jgi:hypothetical protein
MTWQWVPIADLMGPPGTAPEASTQYYRRALNTSEDLDTVTTPGLYGATGTPLAASLVNCPEPVPGNLQVLGPSSGTIRTQVYYPQLGGLYVRSRNVGTSLWDSWVQIGSRPGRVIPDGTDIEAFRSLGPWRVPSAASAATMTNRPPIAANTAYVDIASHNGAGLGTIRTWKDVTGAGVWFQTLSPLTSAWTEWEKLGYSPDPALGSAGGGHDVKVRQETLSIGGVIGTGGLPVFALRIDHNMVGMMTKLAPMLAARDMPASMCHFVNQFDPDPGYTNDDSTGYDWADVQDLALAGVEPWGHSWSHQDAVGKNALAHEIIESRTEIETQIPKCRLKGFMVPGTTGTSWGGFTNNLADQDIWLTTDAGRMVMETYASANGGGGVINPLATGQTLGWTVYWIDDATTSVAAINMLKQAQFTGKGAILAIHPKLIDAVGGITSTVLGEILDYMVGERNAGRAMVLTVNGLIHSDPDRATRPGLVKDPGFSQGMAQWLGTTGWTATGGVASTTTGGTITQSVNLTTHAWVKGSTRELFAEFKAPTGATVRLGIRDAASSAVFEKTRDVVLPASANWVTVRIPLGIPLTGTADLTIEVGRVSGGAVDLRKPDVLAV